MTTRKDAVQLATKAEKQGWRVSKTRGNHLKFQAPDGAVMFFSSSPSDVRAMKNFISAMCKHGFVR